MDWFKIGKRVCQGCILSPCLFNLYEEYIMWNVELNEGQAEIKTAGRNSNNLRYADDPTLMAENEKELKNLLIKMKEESEKAVLKLNIQSQSWIFIGITDAEAKFQYFSHLLWRVDSLEKTLMLEKMEGRGTRGYHGTRCLYGITDTVDMDLNMLHEMVKDRETWCAAVHGVKDLGMTKRLNNY